MARLGRWPASARAAAPKPRPVTLLIEQRLVLDVAAYHDRVGLIVVPPLCPLSVSSADFAHAGRLIDRAHRAAARWLDAGNYHLPHPERFLSLHHHPLTTATHDRHHALAR